MLEDTRADKSETITVDLLSQQHQIQMPESAGQRSLAVYWVVYQSLLNTMSRKRGFLAKVNRQKSMR